MNNRLIKGILFDLNNVASYNNCGLDRLIRIEENNHELFGCRECTVADIAREDMIGTVFCPLMMKRDLEFRVK